jgi:hypothetical protein
MREEPTREEWAALLEAALAVRDLAPWQWMEETDVFGVQDPDNEELGFVSVMGGLGEHLGVSVYQGGLGLEGFWQMQEADSHPDVAEVVLETPQLQASFEDREELEKADRDRIAALGLKIRGRKAWPLFRSYRPGFLPWSVTLGEARFLTAALRELADVAPRFRTSPGLLRDLPEGKLLCRVPESGRWVDRLIPEPPGGRHLDLFVNPQALAYVRRLPRGADALELDFFRVPGAIEEGEGPPRLAYVLLMAHARSGVILGLETVAVETTLEELWGRLPALVSQFLAKAKLRPKELRVRNPVLLTVLEPLTRDLGSRLKDAARLPKIDAIRGPLLEHFGG